MIRKVELTKPPLPSAERSTESAEWARLCRIVRKGTGLDLKQYRSESLQRRVRSICRTKGFVRNSDLLAWLDQNEANVTWLVDRLAVNVSEVFRDPERWSDLRRRVLPMLRQDRPALRAWSAGCSGGAEPFSLAMALSEDCPGPHDILGTDIDEAMLSRAQSGLLEPHDVARLPEEVRRRHLTSASGGRWRVNPELRAMTRFERHDLLSDPMPSDLDLILCRNVAIYFKSEAKQKLYASLIQALRPGGVLFLGSAERIYSPDRSDFEPIGPNFYQRKPVRREVAA